MDAIEIMRHMHEEAKHGFQEMESCQTGQRGSHWDALKPNLIMHEQLEERFLYDPLAHEGKLDDWDFRHHKQVGEAEALVKKIDGFQPHDDGWLETVKTLHHALEEHIATEEGEIWPLIQKAWDAAKLAEVGRQIETAKAADSGPKREQHAA